MGAVYKGTSPDGEPVALKRLLDKQHAARFEIEARLLQRLNHPRVVGVRAHLDDPTGSWLVMDLVDGIDLGRILGERASGRLNPDEAIPYAVQCCEALEYVHAQQIVHRDVKPENLILTSDKGVVLVDFGVARDLDSGSSGTVAGTPRFMAPEVLTGAIPSARSDVFSLAATLWKLLTGVPPSYGDRVKLSQMCDVPESIEDAIAQALEIMPERRIASAAEFAEKLDAPLQMTATDEMGLSLPQAGVSAELLQAIVRTAAGVFGAAAASLALADPEHEGLTFKASWGAGADEVIGMRLMPGVGIIGAVASEQRSAAVPDCRRDDRFAAQVAAGTGYIPYTMLAVPLINNGETWGVLSLLDRRDGQPYGVDDILQAELFADLALAALGKQGPRSTVVY